MRLKWPKILRKSQENQEAQFPKFTVFTGHKSIFLRYCIQNVKDGIQTQAGADPDMRSISTGECQIL